MGIQRRRKIFPDEEIRGDYNEGGIYAMLGLEEEVVLGIQT